MSRRALWWEYVAFLIFTLHQSYINLSSFFGTLFVFVLQPSSQTHTEPTRRPWWQLSGTCHSKVQYPFYWHWYLTLILYNKRKEHNNSVLEPLAPHTTHTSTRAKTCNLSRPSTGKHATGTKSGKTCNRCQARENMQPVPSARKLTPDCISLLGEHNSFAIRLSNVANLRFLAHFSFFTIN